MPKNTDAYFARVCAVETHVKIWQRPPYAEIYRKKAAPQSEHPDQAPAFTATVRTLQGGHTVWVKIQGGKLIINIRSSKNNNKSKKY